MEINFNVKGQERKNLATAISEITEQPLTNEGAPTFAWVIGTYSISRNGTLTISGEDSGGLLTCLREKGFDFEDEPSDLEEIPESEQPDGLTIEMPLDGFTPEKLDNLMKLVNAKSALIKMALGVETLPIQQTGDTLKFPWFPLTEDGGTVAAYAQLVEKLCNMAKTQKRVTTREKEVEGSPKYAMRCLLLRLGFIGDEYKTSRKILLAKMTGSGAHKSVARSADSTAVVAETGSNSEVVE
ncbi:hypothetical protein FACS18949_06480 [Clostridia bacterium]|nr:hypothetical protein FACS18949_06480 [Clostridia bacterium]